MTTGVRYDINLTRGSSYSASLTLTNSAGTRVNLSGYSGYAPVKTRYGATGSGLGEFVVSITSAVSGIFSLSMTDENSALLPCTQAAYEVNLYSSGSNDPFKYINGYVNVYPSI
jgi:hypothetical protein